MRVFVFCEYSDVVGSAFRAEGHDVTSCDLLPSEGSPNHYQGDGRHLLREPWDLVIAHPPCTYLCRAGQRWLNEQSTGNALCGTARWDAMTQAADFFLECLASNAPYVAVENSRMHNHALKIVGRKPDCVVHPWHFGDGESKATCFWLNGLLPLLGSIIHPDKYPRVHNLPPGPERAKDRSRFSPGMAAAMAKQWGAL